MVTKFAYHKINLAIPIALGMIGLLCYGYFFRQGETSYALMSLLLLVIAGVTMVEILISKVELGEKRLVIQRLFKRQEFERDKIEKVTWAKGCPVAVLCEGRWIPLPSLGKNSLSVTNSIRAWLRKKPDEPPPADGRARGLE